MRYLVFVGIDIFGEEHSDGYFEDIEEEAEQNEDVPHQQPGRVLAEHSRNVALLNNN